MSSSKIPVHQHRKKKYVYQERSAPFPVPIASITREKEAENHWYHFTGEIVRNQVLVQHSGDISYLSDMGFFGRGLMSRGAPTLYDDLPYVHIPTSNNEEVDVVNVMRRHMYLRHVKWRKSLDKLNDTGEGDKTMSIDSASNVDEEFDSDVDYFGLEHNELPPPPGPYYEQNEHFMSSQDAPVQQNQDDLIKSEDINSSNEKAAYNSWESLSTNQKTVFDLWQEASTNERSAIENWNTAEADEDFWASEDLTPKHNPKINDKDGNFEYKISNELSIGGDKNSDEGGHSPPIKKVKLDESIDDSKFVIKNCDNVKDKKLTDVKCESESVNLKGDSTNVIADTANDSGKNSNSKLIGNNDICIPMDISDDQNTSKLARKECRTKFTTSDAIETNIYHCVETSEPSTINSDSKVKANEICSKHEVTTKSGDVSENSLETLQSGGESLNTLHKGEFSQTLQKGESLQNLQNGDSAENLQKGDSDFTLQNGCSPLPVHPYCNHDDITDTDNVPDYLVIDDSDIDDSTVHVPLKQKTKWLPVRKKEVFQFNEPLMLSFEEAFFLCYGLGCLTVTNETHEKLSIQDLWSRFNQQTFLPRYVAYHYFRSKGWVPKPNILFGTDLLVYKVGPAFYHASYSVIIRTIYEDTYEEVPCFKHKKMTWCELSGLNRVTEHVAKTLVYCYVVCPRDLTEDEMMSPQCLSRFKVRLQYVHRWISSQEREQNKNTTTK